MLLFFCLQALVDQKEPTSKTKQEKPTAVDVEGQLGSSTTKQTDFM